MTDTATLFDLADSAAECEKRRMFQFLDESDWKDETRAIVRVIVEAAFRKAEFSANDVRDDLPADVSSPRIGRAFALACESGLIEWVGYVRSTDVGTHAKRIGLYRRAS